MTNTTKTLLETALSAKFEDNPEYVSPDELDLLIAAVNGEVESYQVAAALGETDSKKRAMLANGWVKTKLRRAIEAKQVRLERLRVVTPRA